MNVKKFLVATLVIALSTLFVNQVSALTITIFAPSAYPYVDLLPGSASSNGNAPLPDANGWVPNQYAPVNPAISGWAETWEITPSMLFTGPTQQGSVHADTWLYYLISGSAGIRVQLFHVQFGLGTMRVWYKGWSDALTPPGGEANTVDLGICYYDLSIFNFPGPQNPLPFQWTNGYNYITYVAIWAFANAGSLAFIEIAKYDDILWIFYTSSPEVPWMQSPGPEISLNPIMGPVKSRVAVRGNGFAKESKVYIYFNSTLVNQTTSTLGGIFESWFNVPDPSAKGPHRVRAIDALENSADSFFDVFIEAAPTIGDITGDTEGVPDGKTDMVDMWLVAKNFGKTDPNVDPPEGGGGSGLGISVGILGLTSIASVSIGLVGQRKRQKITKQTQRN